MTLARSASLITLLTALAACGGPQTPTPKPPRFDMAAQPLGQLDPATGGGLAVQAAPNAPAVAPHALLALSWSGPWPDAMTAAPPIVAQATVDGAGDAWLTSARAGAVLGADVWGATPKESRHLRPGTQRVQVSSSAVKAAEGKLHAMKGDRVVFVALRDGPLSKRIVGTGRATADNTLKVTAGEVQGDVLAIRAGSVADDIEAEPLTLRAAVDPACNAVELDTLVADLKEATGGLGEVAVTKGEPTGASLTVTITACDGATPTVARVSGPGSGAALETAFWSAQSLDVPLNSGSLAAVAPIVAARRGELAEALWLQSLQKGGASELMSAALALKVGWWTDVGPLLRSSPKLASAVESRLFSAEAAYRLGDLNRAIDLLRAPFSGTATPGCLATRCARVGASAARALAWAQLGRGQADVAKQGLQDAATNAKDPNDARALRLTLLQLQLMVGAPDQELLKDDPDAPPRHQAELLRYRALAQLQRGGAVTRAELICRAAELYDSAHAWQDAVDMWLECAQARGVSGPNAEAAAKAIEQATIAAKRAMQPQALAHALVGRYLATAERHATNRVPPANAGILLKLSVQEARRAELFGQAGRVQRYGLLLLPATADINVRAKLLRDGLNDALAGVDGIETAFLLSLMGQLEAMRQRYTEAEALLAAAVALAEAIGEPQLAVGFAEELKAIQE